MLFRLIYIYMLKMSYHIIQCGVKLQVHHCTVVVHFAGWLANFEVFSL